MTSLYRRRFLALPLGMAAAGLAGCSVFAEAPDPIMARMRAVPALRELPSDAGVSHHQHALEASHPFSSMYCSVGGVDLAKYGYVEKEFLLSGQAHVYGLDAAERAVVQSGPHPYATRLLVRYPADPSKFTGRVYIDILNASSGVDLEDIWRRSWDHILKSGHAYVGITSKSDTANALTRFDARRYAGLNWKADGKDENGLFWDMASQLGTLLRQPQAGGLLGGLSPEWVYLGGQSQSGMVLNTYLAAFANRLDRARDGGRPLFDGYLSLVGPSSLAIANSGPAPRTLYRATRVPQIVMMSEAEHSFYQVTAPPGFPPFAPYERPADSDAPQRRIRFYEVAGAPHSDPTSPILPNNAEIARANNGRSRPPKQYNPGHSETDLNIDPLVNAALENLHAWAAQGRPAPPAQSRWIDYDIRTDAKGNAVFTARRDAMGNTLGGIRLPQLAAPLHRFYAMRNGVPFDTDGSMVRLSREQITTLYPGGRADYLARFDAAADALARDGYLLAGDVATLKAWARSQSLT